MICDRFHYIIFTKTENILNFLFLVTGQMSHYQHNINTPQFLPGAHLSHYSLTNTTLIGQEVQQRLWEKYWGQQYTAPPPPYLWPHPGVYCYGYPYGFPGIFSPVSLQRGLEQLQRPVLWQIEERCDNDSTGRVGKQFLESNRGQNVLVEVLEEGNGWSTNRNQGADKHEKDAYPVRQKVIIGIVVINSETFSKHRRTFPRHHHDASTSLLRGSVCDLHSLMTNLSGRRKALKYGEGIES